MEKLQRQLTASEPAAAPRLVIDFGNTLTKTAVYSGDDEIFFSSTPHLTIDQLEKVRQAHAPVYAIAAGVVDMPDAARQYLIQNFHFTEFTHLTAIPIQNLYKTPETLGLDRLAVAVYAGVVFAGTPCLVIDAGTCVTWDFVDADSCYRGGGITPGLTMRYRALHTFTERLPLVTDQNFEGLAGTTTQESIQAGVALGIVAEMEGIIQRFVFDHPNLKVLITGGDRNFFAKKLKSNIFAIPNLVLRGLNIILDFNVNKQQEGN
ncbi:MAG: type III pantothenate kinase [Bacteroidales bacterium]|nr:type III pantothenate kinase [Bacteroidales bacterium]